MIYYSQPYTKSLKYDENIATKKFNIATKKIIIPILQIFGNPSQFGSNTTYLLHQNAIRPQHIILVAIIDTLQPFYKTDAITHFAVFIFFLKKSVHLDQTSRSPMLTRPREGPC
jgi:hypothetical protein